MRLIDNRHCNDLEPYIPERNNEEVMDAEYDFTIEKFLIFDVFLKRLYLLSKIHDIFKNCKKLVKVSFRRGFQTKF